MTLFIAHENLHRDGDDGLVCLADRFNWLAFLLPPIWAMSKGLWGVLGIMLALIVGLAFASQVLEYPIFTVWILGAWWLGFEANALQGASLKKRGWQENGIFVADSLMQAERKYFGRKRRQNHRARRALTADRDAI